MSTFEQELKACLRAIRACEYHIKRAKSVKVFSDNMAACLNLQKTNPSNMTLTTIKLITEIQTRTFSSNITFSHLPGVKNYVADCLCRLEYNERHVNNVIEEPMISTRQDVKIKEQIYKLHQQSHFGVAKLINLAKEQGMTNNRKLRMIIDQVISECPLCRIETKILAHNVIGHNKTPSKEFQTIYIDHMEMRTSSEGHSYIMTIFCPFSKFVVAVPCETKSIREVILRLHMILNVFGHNIEEIRGDNAFSSHRMNDFCEENGLKFIPNCSNNSRQNPGERVHRTLREQMKIHSEKEDYEDGNWELWLQKAVNSINVTPNLTTGYSPYRLVFHHVPNLLNEDNPQEVEEIRKEVYDRIEGKKKKYAVEDLSKIPTLKEDEKFRVRYDTKRRDEHFDAICIKDMGLDVLCKRVHGKGKRYAELKVHKRHIYRLNNDKESPFLKDL